MYRWDCYKSGRSTSEDFREFLKERAKIDAAPQYLRFLWWRWQTYCSLIPVAGLRDWRFESLFFNEWLNFKNRCWVYQSWFVFDFYRGELLKGVDLTPCSSQNVVQNKPLLVILIIGSEPSKYVHMARCIYLLKRKRIAFPINMHLDRKGGNDILKHVPTQDGWLPRHNHSCSRSEKAFQRVAAASMAGINTKVRYLHIKPPPH